MMDDTSSFDDRRKKTRISVENGTAALLTYDQVKIGKIIDISLGGIGFSYIGDTDGDLTGKTCRIDMLIHSYNFYFEKIPCNIISDFVIQNNFSLDAKPLKRCDIQFQELNRSQKAQLEYLITSHEEQPPARQSYLEKQLIHSEEKYRTILESIEEGYFEVDLTGNVTFFNSSMLKMIGYTEHELLGMNYRGFMDQWTAQKVFREYNKAFRTGALPTPFDWELVKKSGEKIHVETSLSFIKNSRDEIIGFRGVARDISIRKKFEEELLYMASHDHLTGLYNRGALFERLRSTLAYARRFNKKCSLLFLDLDNFKNVNDAFGHEAGDMVLQETARRLAGILRETDYLCRHGGDEFTILLNNPDNMNPEKVARKIIETITVPFQIKEHTIDFITTSIGISVYPEDGATIDDLVKHADQAMYRAKEMKNTYICYNKGRFSPTMAGA
ncbi:MAG: sensor domain-containing diguanylate cyclase [Thermodesulfobacteriota bacterium]